jgi:hypothetical protein
VQITPNGNHAKLMDYMRQLPNVPQWCDLRSSMSRKYAAGKASLWLGAFKPPQPDILRDHRSLVSWSSRRSGVATVGRQPQEQLVARIFNDHATANNSIRTAAIKRSQNPEQSSTFMIVIRHG